MDWNTIAQNLHLQKCVVDSVPTIGCAPVVYTLLVNALLTLIGTVSAIFLIVAGYKLIFARGDAKELDGAHKSFFYALIGLIIVFLSFLIISLIGYITGATCITQFGFGGCGTNVQNTTNVSSPASRSHPR